MKFEVIYDDAEPIRIAQGNRPSIYQHVFTMDGSTAVHTSEPSMAGVGPSGEDVRKSVKELPFVQAVTLDEYEDKEQ